MVNLERLQRPSNLSRQLQSTPLLERYNRFLGSVYNPQMEAQRLPDQVREQVDQIIFRNNLMSHILNSKEFADILTEEKKLRGEDTKVGVIICIDGRICILNQFGRALNVKEIAGSLIELFPDKSKISDMDFITLLDQSADEGRDLLETVTAHTGHHGCGRIGLGISNHEFSGDPVEVAINEAKKRAGLITEKYNQILVKKGKKLQKQTAIAAMINTDDMGLTLNPGEKNQLSTTGFTQRLKNKLEHNFPKNQFGSMQQDFNKPEHFIEYSKKVLEVTKYLMETETKSEDGKSQVVNVKKYIKNNYPDLTEKQQKALLFTFCRTIANQYVTGMSSEKTAKTSPLADHNEQYMVVSTGKPFGRFEIGVQSFGSATASSEEMLRQVSIELGLLDSHKKTKPYILFLSTSIDPTSKNPNVGRSIEFYQALLQAPIIIEKIEKGELYIVPIEVDEQNGRVIKIDDYSEYV